MPISPSRRWEVFRRDGFRCAYCGHAAEDGAVLTLDHIVPRSSGGTDDIENLHTACQDCNAGKSDAQPDGVRRRPRRKAAAPVRRALPVSRQPPVRSPKRVNRHARTVIADTRPVEEGSFCWTPLGIACMAYTYGNEYSYHLRLIEKGGFPTPAGPRNGKAAMAWVLEDPNRAGWIASALHAIFGEQAA